MGKCEKIRRFVSVPGTRLQYPETVIYGAHEGACVTVSAGVHCREYVGIQAVIELARELEPQSIRGELHLVHAFNYDGLICRCSDVFPSDGKNLNRVFPGSACGTDAEKLAAFLEERVIRRCDYIIDLHSGGGYEYLTPHVYFHGGAAANVCARSQEMAMHVGVDYAVRSRAKNGFYSHAGTCGVPAVLIERGCCGLWSEQEVAADIADVKNLLRHVGVLCDGIAPVRKSPEVFDGGEYIDAPVSGCWYPTKKIGQSIKKGESLGRICDIFGTPLHEELARCDGVVLYQTASLGIEKDKPMIAYAARR